MKKEEQNTEHLTHKKFFGGKVLTGILLVIFLFSFFMFISIVFEPADTNKNVEIAALLPLTGQSVEAGLTYKQGIDMAATELRKTGENISIRYFDTEGDPNKALDAFFIAVDANIPAILGPITTAEAEVIAPYAEMYKKTVITYGTGSSLENYKDYVFHFDPSNRNIGYAVVKFIKQINETNLSVVWAETSLGRSIYDTIAEFAEKEKISIISIPITSAAEVVMDLHEAGTPFTFIATETPEQFDEILQEDMKHDKILQEDMQLNESIHTLWLSSDTGFGDIIRDNYSMKNLLVLVPTVSTVDPLFLDNYRIHYNETFDVSNGYLLYGYDSLKTLISALPLNRENIQSEDIAKNLQNYRYIGQTGPVVFDEKLERIPMYEIYFPNGGTWKKVEISELLDQFELTIKPLMTHEDE